MHPKSIPAARYGGPPIHPGVILRDEFTAPLGLSTYALAKALHVPQTRLGEIMAGRRSITADTALRLSRYFETPPALWLNLQATYDLRVAELKYGATIFSEVKARVAQAPR